MPRTNPLAPLAVAVSVAVACGDTTAATGFTTAPVTTAPLSTSGSSTLSDSSSTSGNTGTSTGASGEDSTASGSGTGTTGIADVGQIPDFPTTPGCQGKIDFLFVISSNEEMAYKQVQLQEAFPEFVKILEADFADFDYHVMAVDAAGGTYLPSCDICYSCSQVMCDGPGCSQWGGPPDYPCDEIFEECTAVQGAGVTVIGNFDASNKRCLPADGPRFITKDAPDLKGTFECISKLGAGPKHPIAARMMMRALEPEILSKWGCNKGFLRPDALLAIVLVSGDGDKGGDPDSDTPGTPADWYEAVVEAKQGNEDAVVILALSHDHDALNPKCVSVDTSTSSLRELADAAKHGHFASMCEQSYVPFLKDMAGTILELCSIFIPPQ
ncbi:hypothetical protein [Nannocystis pusilla]|uniref:hypothetical protein n=1 Tax=Nannocystis pusilla TaxID=889268 RepID=UPI003BEF5E09